MILAKFRHKYPQGSLVSELIEIDRGTYIVKATVQINNVILATGLASAVTVEAAEDAARERAIAILFLDAQTEMPIPTPAKTPKPQTPSPTIVNPAPSEPSISDNVNFSEPQSATVRSQQPLAPATVPLKAIAEPQLELEPEPTTEDPQPAHSNTLFGDTANAELTPQLNLETESEPIAVETQSVTQELEAMDFNEIKQKTDIEIKRLSWTKDRGKDFLMSRYGKRSRLHLTDEQLLEFLRYLETQPTPVK